MLRHFCLTLITATLFAHHAAAQVAHFDQYPEGPVGDVFVDTISGIRFQDVTVPDSPFVIERSSAVPSRPLTSPGGLLSTFGFAPGDTIGLTSDFGFTAILPQPARTLSFDVVYVTNGPNAGLDLLLFGSAGQLLDATRFTFANANFAERRIAIPDRAVADIASFRIAGVTDLGTAYDNITIPEPASSAGVVFCALIRRRR